jgi:SAM-dependent methyltransferase
VSERDAGEGLVPRHARPALRRGDVTGWFEPVYAGADRDAGGVPWAHQQPNPLLLDWLERRGGAGEHALVVGCGLGDDVAALAAAGADAYGFDVAPSAISWAQERFPALAERFRTADLLELPAAFAGAWELVFEAFTIQALPVAVRRQAIEAVASLVAAGGTLLVVCTARDPDEDPGRLPWPLTRDEVARFAATGLQEVRFEDIRDPPEGARKFRAEFRRPERPVSPCAP